MDLNEYTKVVYKYGLTRGFEKLDIRESVKNIRAEADVLYKSLFQNGVYAGNDTYIEGNRLIAKNLANMFIVICQVAKFYDIDLEEAFKKELEKERKIEFRVPR